MSVPKSHSVGFLSLNVMEPLHPVPVQRPGAPLFTIDRDDRLARHVSVTLLRNTRR